VNFTRLPSVRPTVTRSFQRQLLIAELPRSRFHDLQHGAATLLLSQGVPLKVVQEALGHATIAVTADVYGHLLELQKDPRNVWAMRFAGQTKISWLSIGLSNAPERGPKSNCSLF